MTNNKKILDEKSKVRVRAIRIIKYLLFSASIVPALVAGAASFTHHQFTLLHFLLVSVALFVGQMGGDYLYFYFTSNHTDSDDSHTKIFKGWQPLGIDYFPQEKGSFIAGLICVIIDFFIGIFFFMTHGWPVIIFASIGFLLMVFFTPLMRRGLKELVVFITFGPLCLIAVGYILQFEITSSVIAVSFPIGFLVTVVAYLKGAKFNLEQHNDEIRVVKLNKLLLYGITFLAYLSIGIGVYTNTLPSSALAGFLTIPLSVSVMRVIENQQSSIEDYLWATVRSILNLLLTGILLGGAFILDTII